MNRLVVVNGYGRCKDKNRTEFVVLRADGLYNLGIDEGYGISWVKENVKRISTLQKFLDERNYNVKIDAY